MAEIVLDNLRKDFGEFTAVEASSFTVADGEFFMLLGHSRVIRRGCICNSTDIRFPRSVTGKSISGRSHGKNTTGQPTLL